MGVLDLRTYDQVGEKTTGTWSEKISISSSNTDELTPEHLWDIAQSNNLVEGAHLDIFGLIQSIDGVVFMQSLMTNPDVSGSLEKINGDWLIKVNKLHHVNRQRFTAAHELAHYVLHRHLGDFTDTILFRDGKSNSVEWEANQFAADLLMPEKIFKSEVKKHPRIDKLSEIFCLSPLAIQVRAKSLGFMTSAA